MAPVFRGRRAVSTSSFSRSGERQGEGCVAGVAAGLAPLSGRRWRRGFLHQGDSARSGDGGAGVVDSFFGRQDQIAVALDQQVVVREGEIDHAGTGGLLVFGPLDFKQAFVLEQGGEGSALLRSAGTCRTMKIGQGKFAGSVGRRVSSACTPPVGAYRLGPGRESLLLLQFAPPNATTSSYVGK